MTTHHSVGRRHAIFKKILSRVAIPEVPDACWIWTGPTSGDGRGGGYGRVSINGQTSAVHLIMYTHAYGYIPGNREVDHSCNNRLCCNPNHLVLVTRAKNERLKRKRMK